MVVVVVRTLARNRGNTCEREEGFGDDENADQRRWRICDKMK
ncbi:hypothetical protein L195_g038807, partial [Trifolium pratense]